MDQYRKEYLVGKLDRHVTDMAELLQQLRDERSEDRLVKLELTMVCHGRGVAVRFSVDGAPNLPQVAALEQELGLVDGPDDAK